MDITSILQFFNIPVSASLIDTIFFSVWVVLTTRLVFFQEKPLIYTDRHGNAPAAKGIAPAKRTLKNHLIRWATALSHGPFFVLSSFLSPVMYCFGVCIYAGQCQREALWMSREVIIAARETKKQKELRQSKPPGSLSTAERMVMLAYAILFVSILPRNMEVFLFGLFVAVMLIVSYHLKAIRRNADFSDLSAMAMHVFIVFYFGSLGPFTVHAFYDLKNGGGLVCMVLLGAIFSDVIAYYVGSLWGRFRAVPNISKAKTIEGMVAALVGCPFLTFCFYLCRNFKVLDLPLIPLYQYLLIGLVIAIFAIIGDLVESFFKRSCAVKDSGTSFTGHGGIWDRFDSMFLSYPACYFFVRYIIYGLL